MFEIQYKNLIHRVLNYGDYRKGRNGNTFSLFGETLSFDLEKEFPLLLGRKIYHKGVFGELAALLRQPKNIEDFKKFDCHYWDLWKSVDGSINVDYGNKWLNWDGVNQLENLITTLKENPTDRRMLISGWDPRNIDNLDLPCCHYMYQWYVRRGRLDMLWNQRSVDTMIGLPSDAVFAAVWNIAIANEVGLKAGKVTMMLGDTHIYDEHMENIQEYLDTNLEGIQRPSYELRMPLGQRTVDFVPSDIEIVNYNPVKKIKFELKG
jgi:thymidylate synthase